VIYLNYCGNTEIPHTIKKKVNIENLKELKGGMFWRFVWILLFLLCSWTVRYAIVEAVCTNYTVTKMMDAASLLLPYLPPEGHCCKRRQYS